MKDRTFSLDELCTLTGFSKRTVRYYIQFGLVDRPLGETRAAYYSEIHLEQLLKTKRLVDSGISLDRIREILAGEDEPVSVVSKRPGFIEVKSHLYVMPGIELIISPEDSGLTPDDIRELAREIMAVAKKISEKKKDD